LYTDTTAATLSAHTQGLATIAEDPRAQLLAETGDENENDDGDTPPTADSSADSSADSDDASCSDRCGGGSDADDEEAAENRLQEDTRAAYEGAGGSDSAPLQLEALRCAMVEVLQVSCQSVWCTMQVIVRLVVMALVVL
jgi:hypothetical protein